VTDLLIERREGCIEVTFNRPEKFNSFTRAMYTQMRELFLATAQDPSIRAVVLRGAGGKAFAAGNDIADFLSQDQVSYEAEIRTMFDALAALPQVTIAAIDGVCVGGGLGIATFCDVRVATAKSKFGYPIAKTLGNALSSPVLFRCAAVFGESITREMLLTARLVTAGRAYGIGALTEVVEDGEALTAAVATLVEEIRPLSGVTRRTTKDQLSFRAGVIEQVPDGEEALLRQVYGGPDFAEGVRAFLAKEKPAFS
jgi:enoyl-CoA hydratase/carnithine racemase